jgi:hypothetical protein
MGKGKLMIASSRIRIILLIDGLLGMFVRLSMLLVGISGEPIRTICGLEADEQKPYHRKIYPASASRVSPHFPVH